KPSAPQGPIEFTDIKADSTILTWKPPSSDGGAPIKSYVIERRDARKTTWTKIASTDSKTLSCTAQKLIEDTPYIFRVFAVNDEGQSEPLEADKELIPKTPA
ncbi:titin isoform X2, partial [Biomphalaria glabrata]